MLHFSQTSLLHYVLYIDGVAKNEFLTTWERKSAKFIMSRSIFTLPPYKEMKTMREELESNPGPHAFRVTVLTTAPWLLEQIPKTMQFIVLGSY